MKAKWIVALVLCLSCIAQAKDFDVTIWGGIETGNSDSTAAMSGRLGIQSDNLEGFLGVTGWPRWDAIEGRLTSEPPVVLEVGGIYHLNDIVDANSSLPWLPDALITFINPEVEARPYIGGRSTIGNEGSYYGAIMGLEMTTTPDSRITTNVEAQFNNVDHEVADAGVTDEFRVMVFLKYKF